MNNAQDTPLDVYLKTFTPTLAIAKRLSSIIFEPRA
jgi:hypothetical protein